MALSVLCFPQWQSTTLLKIFDVPLLQAAGRMRYKDLWVKRDQVCKRFSAMPIPKRRYEARSLCLLPVDSINRTLETELEAGYVHLSSKAHRHIAGDHPSDYELVMRYLEETIQNPTFIGQSPRQGRNFELVKRVRLSNEVGYVLVAVSMETDDDGLYRVKSAYLLEAHKVENRRRTGHLRMPK